MPPGKQQVINFDFTHHPVAGAVVQAIGYGQGTEMAVFGARGDGKTWAAFVGMILHAQVHESLGFPLPTRWIGVRDSFANHRMTTCNSLENPLWQGGWQGFDGKKEWIFSMNMGAGRARKQLVRLLLFGIEDQNAMDKLRLETQGVDPPWLLISSCSPRARPCLETPSR